MVTRKFWSTLIGCWTKYLIAIAICYFPLMFILVPFLRWRDVGVWSMPSFDLLLYIAKYALFCAFGFGVIAWIGERWWEDRKDQRADEG